MREKKKNKLNTFLIIQCVVGGLIGAICGFSLVFFSEKLGNIDFLDIVLIFLILYVVFFLSTIIHEAGHLVMGILTGYKFVSFRIGSFIITKDNGKIKLGRFSIAGTSGQCLLSPPETDEPVNVPYFWYHFGGGFFNLLTALICFPVQFAFENKYLKIAFIAFGIISLFAGIMNLIPVKAPIPNDGMNILRLHKSQKERIITYRQLKINALLYSGIKPTDIPEELFEEIDDEESLHACAIPLLKASCIMYDKKFIEAEKIFCEFAENDKIIDVYKNESRCELVFCKIINGASKDEIDKIYDKKLRAIVKQASKSLISKKRLKYTYTLVVMGDKAAAEKEYEQIQKLKNKYPCKGEPISELELIDYVRSKYSS